MPPRLADRLREMATHIDAVGKAWDEQYAIGFGADEKQCAVELREAAAALDRTEALEQAAQAWAKAKVKWEALKPEDEDLPEDVTELIGEWKVAWQAVLDTEAALLDAALSGGDPQ